MYTFGSSLANNSSSLPRKAGVCNYVTHNGDFDFYTVNKKCYDLEVVQQWLEIVLETPMPATVDSGKGVFCNFSFVFYVTIFTNLTCTIAMNLLW